MTTPTPGKSALSENPTPSTPEPGTKPKLPQFDLQSLLWLTVTICIALMYLRPFGQRAVLEAAGVIAVAAAAGLVVGTMRGAVGDVLYWSVLGAAFAFISTVTGRLVHWTTPYAWAGVGIATGCAVGSCRESHWLRTLATGGISAGLVMGIYTAFLVRATGELDWFDLASSGPIGIFFGLLVVILHQVQRRSMLRYDATATLLMAAIVAGNYLSRVVVPIVILAVIFCGIPGCGEPVATADPAPFEAAVTKYLAQNDMQLRLKAIRQGPTVTGDEATMSASMTHRELGGPSVVWTFRFSRAEGIGWTVAGHSDK